MVKDAVISIRVEPSLKAHLEETAQRRGMIAGQRTVDEILATHSRSPQ